MSHLANTTVAGRPRPVLVVASILVTLQAVAAAAEFTDTIPDAAFGWIILAIAGLQALLALWTQGQVTPLADPKDTSGRALVPALPAGPSVEG